MDSHYLSEIKRERNKEKWQERYEREGHDRRFIALLDQYVNTGRTPKSNSKLYSMCEERGISVQDAMSERRKHLENVRSRKKR